MPRNVAPVLTDEDFPLLIDWLRIKARDGQYVGLACSPARCPLHEWLRATRDIDCDVYLEVVTKPGDKVGYDLPGSFRQFATQLDAPYTPNGTEEIPIEAETALRVAERVWASYSSTPQESTTYAQNALDC